MLELTARRALLPDGWADHVTVAIDNGKIKAVTPGSTATPTHDTLLPALANLHSHSFQRAMAGMTERRGPSADSFWTWRTLMYRFVEKLTPDQVQAIAAQVFVEMLEAGYASVGEFHYLHHAPGGARYDTLAELSGRIAAAAQETGIGVTLLPVLYSYGGAGQRALEPGQARFGADLDEYLRLVEGAEAACKSLPADTVVGIAPHSLRATSPADLRALLAARPDGPVHMHIAEQPREVADVRATYGARPVEWALGEIGVGPRWCMIHATHMEPAETRGLAQSGAVAGLCPITEANLGDGPFNGPSYLAHGGRFGVGSDSNVRVALAEELRTLEYSQRLRDLGRNVLGDWDQSTGARLYEMAAQGGAQAVG
ncbi:MAG: formimidoylglutamate deiminase, partial [Pseudomonadota bacterium]